MDGSLDRRLNENVIHATLKELQDLLLDTDKLKARYKLSLVARSFSPQEAAQSIAAPVIQGVLSNAISDEVRGDILYRARLTQTRNRFPQRLWWAAIDKVKFEELIGTIKAFVRELWLLIDPWRQDDMSQSLQMILSNVVSMSRKVDDLQSLRETLLSPSNASDPSQTRGRMLPIASAAQVKAIQIGIGALMDDDDDDESIALGLGNSQSQSRQSSRHSVPNFYKDSISNYEPMKSSPDMGLATYENENVFIEWKSLAIQFRSKILKRAQNLALLLQTPKHPDFQSLHCRGLVRDNDGGRIAFVYDLPSNSDGTPPRSLRSLFSSTPSVTERLRLALQITYSVKYFHMAGWLHKNLRSENMLFFPSAPAPPTSFPISFPILAGFTFSRLNSPSEISEQASSDPQRDIYRHPDAMGEPSTSFNATKDIYALGTVLLEIGEWRSLKSLVERIVDVSKVDVPLTQLAKVKPFLLDEAPRGGLGMLRYRMGDIYAKVTKSMLSGDILEGFEAKEDSGGRFRPGLLDVAIRELERCVA